MDKERSLLLFDYDGTLCNTLDAISASLLATFQEFAQPPPEGAEIARLIGTGKTLKETIAELLPHPLDGESMKQWVAFYRKRYSSHGDRLVTLFDDVAPVLARLSASSRLVLISNKGIEAVESSLRRFGIRDFFALALAEEQGQPKKPDPGVFAERILPVFPDATPEDCIVIGDTAADLEFARNIGAASCYAAYGYGDRATCEAIGYTFSIDALRDLTFLCCDPSAADAEKRPATGRRTAELEIMGD